MTSRNEEDDLCYIKIISTAGLLSNNLKIISRSSTHFTTTFSPLLVIKINPLPMKNQRTNAKLINDHSIFDFSVLVI